MTQIFAILNITPDSYSDGGKYFAVENAINYTKQMLELGADVIDIGAEATSGNKHKDTPTGRITQEEEWNRLKDILPEVIDLTKNYNKKVSIDTRNYQTAAKAIEMGVDFINDVAGGDDLEMIQVVRQNNIPYVIMHSVTLPADKNITIDEHEDVVTVINKWFEQKLEQLKDLEMILDPGIGFGKSAKQDLAIIQRVGEFKVHGKKLLIGHSKKSFIRPIAIDENDRTLETNIMSAYLINKNIDYIRVHDIKDTIDVRNMTKRLVW